MNQITFKVQAGAKGTNGTFSFRIVAKRKDIEGPRFEIVTMPPPPKSGEVAQTVKPAQLPDATQRQVTPAVEEQIGERP